MDRVYPSLYDLRQPLPMTIERGIAELFQPCHDPLPEKMERLIAVIQDWEQADICSDRSQSKSPG
jgi:hypothetical protein